MKIWLIAFIQLSQNSLMRLFFHFIYQMSSAHVSLILFIKKFCRLQHQVYTHSKYIVLQWYLCYYNSRGEVPFQPWFTQQKWKVSFVPWNPIPDGLQRWEKHTKKYRNIVLHTGPPLPMYLLPTKIRYQTRIIHLVGYKIKDFTSTPSQHSIKNQKIPDLCGA